MSRVRTQIWLANVFLPLVSFAALNWWVAVRGQPGWRLPFEVGAIALCLVLLAAAGVVGSLRSVGMGPSPVRVSVPGMVIQMPPVPVVGQAASRRGPSFLTAVTAYYLVALILRLVIYGLNGQIWGKATFVVAVVLSLVFYERVSGAAAGLSAGTGWGRGILAAAGGLVLIWLAVPASKYLAFWAAGVKPGVHLPVWNGPALSSIWRLGYGNLAEEIFFRGYMLLGLAGSLPAAVANALQALYFAVLHVNYNAFPVNVAGLVTYTSFTFVFGYTLGLLALGTRSILAPVAVHIGYNVLIPEGLYRLDVSGLAAPAVGTVLLSHVVFAVVTWVFIGLAFGEGGGGEPLRARR